MPDFDLDLFSDRAFSGRLRMENYMVVAAVLAATLAVASSGSASKPTLAALFTPAAFKLSMKEFDSRLGPATRVYGLYQRVYDVNGCKVEAQGKDSVNYLALELSDKCSFDLNVFFPKTPLGQVNKLTFGDIDKSLPDGDFSADCILDCARRPNPGFYLGAGSGEGAKPFYYLEAKTGLNTPGARDAAGVWAKTMARKGERWIKAAKFNCERTFYAEGRKAFRPVRVTTVAIGVLPAGWEGKCKGRFLLGPPATPREAAYGRAHHFSPDIPRDSVSFFPADFPKAYRRWRAMLPTELKQQRWAAAFEGVGGDILRITVAGKPMRFAEACQEHACYNDVFMLFSPDQQRTVGLVRLGHGETDEKVLVVGDPTWAELRCLNALGGPPQKGLPAC